MRASLSIAVAIALCGLTAAGAGAQVLDPSEAAQELIQREETRAAVREAFLVFSARSEDGGETNDNMVRAAGMLEELGAPAVSFLATELEQARPSTFVFMAYSLGRIGTPEAEAALRTAIEKAEEEPTEGALIRKAWACYGLALMNRADAVDLLNTGIHKAGAQPIHFRMTVLEAAALLTAPESVPRLHAQIERYANDASMFLQLRPAIRALQRVSDPSSIPVLLGLLKHEEGGTRRDAAHALRRLGTDETVAALIEALKTDVDHRVHYAAARSLELIQPERKPKFVWALLRDETNPFARGPLYRLGLALAGADGLEDLRSQWGRPSGDDRMELVRAVASLRDPRAVGILATAASDHDARVVDAAVRGLVRLGTDTARRVLVEKAGSPTWSTAVYAIRGAAETGASAAAPGILDRLVSQEMAGLVRDPVQRERIYILGEALVSLGYVEALESVRNAAGRQADGRLSLYLESLIYRLEAVQRNGTDVKRWTAELGSADRAVRLLAYERLGSIGGDEAATALVRAFGRVEVEDGVEILEQLGHVDSDASRELFERILIDPEFDKPSRLPLRDMAAWGARRLGGARMLDALDRAVLRRTGRDARVMIYLALLGQERSLATLRKVHAPRMRYLKWTRGNEQGELEWILHELERGRPIDALDVPPGELLFRAPN